MGCVLRVVGESFVPDDFLKSSNLPVYQKFSSGQKMPYSQEFFEYGGFITDIGSSFNLHESIQDATRFLLQYESEIIRIHDCKSVEKVYLDFGYRCRISEAVIIQLDMIPAEFISLVGRLKMGILLSLMPPFTNTTSEIKVDEVASVNENDLNELRKILEENSE